MSDRGDARADASAVPFVPSPPRRLTEGWLVEVPLPAVPRGVRHPPAPPSLASALGCLVGAARERAEGFDARRASTFVGGRLALAAALDRWVRSAVIRRPLGLG